MRGRAAGFVIALAGALVVSGLDLVAPRAAGASSSSVAVQQVSTDPYVNAGAQHQTEVDMDSFAWGSTQVSVSRPAGST